MARLRGGGGGGQGFPMYFNLHNNYTLYIRKQLAFDFLSIIMQRFFSIEQQGKEKTFRFFKLDYFHDSRPIIFFFFFFKDFF